jgi:hypothetical protein
MSAQPHIEDADKAEFYKIQQEFFRCPIDKKCSENYLSKHEIKDMEWYYNPPAEYLGHDYKGIVIVGARPAIPRNQTISFNKSLRERILCFLENPSMENGYAMSKVVGEMIPTFMMTKTGVFRYRDWGIGDEHLPKIAFVNLYKCRVREGNEMDVISFPFRLAPCVRDYFCRQVDILKPKLIIFIWDFLWEGLVNLSSFGIDIAKSIESIFECGPRYNDPHEIQEAKNERIRRRVRKIIHEC